MASTLKSTRGEAVLLYLAILAVAGAALLMFKPKALHGDSKRAAASEAASTQVNTSTDALLTAERQRAAAAAASVVKIGEAAAAAPASPARDFITREVPVALAQLPAPDPQALLEAERRKVAIMEGRLEEAATLYRSALERAEQRTSERDAAAAALAAARADRAAVDSQLAEVAAARLAAERTSARWMIAALVAAGLWLWVKLSHLSPGQLAEAVTDIKRAGPAAVVTDATGRKHIPALDAVASRLQQKLTSLLAKLRA